MQYFFLNIWFLIFIILEFCSNHDLFFQQSIDFFLVLLNYVVIIMFVFEQILNWNLFLKMEIMIMIFLIYITNGVASNNIFEQINGNAVITNVTIFLLTTHKITLELTLTMNCGLGYAK